jgi:translocation and assembly module TamB
MRKVIFRILLILIVVFSLGALGFLLWLEGNGFRNWISKRLDLELQKYNLCLEGDLQVNPLHFQAELNNLKVKACDSTEPIITARHLYLKVRLISLFSSNFQLQDLSIDEPKILITFDEQGHSNFSHIHPPQNTGKETSYISTLTTAIRNGEIIYNNKQVRFDGELKNFTLTALITKSAGTQFNLTSKNSSLKYRNQNVNLEEFDLRAKFLGDRTEIENLKFKSDLATATISGKLSDWQSLKYNFFISANVDLAKVSKTLIPDKQAAGTISLLGKLTGQELDYNFQGELKSSEIIALGVTAKELLLAGEVSKETFSGKISLASLQNQRFLIKAFQSSSLKANRNEIELEKFSANSFGGTIEGKALIGLENHLSKLAAKLTNIDIASASNLLANKPNPLSGTANAEVNLSWPGLNLKAISGQVTANLSGNTQPSDSQAEKFPFSAELSANLNSSNVSLDKALFTSKTTTASAIGTISLNNQTFDLTTKFETDNILESQQIAKQLGLKLPYEIVQEANSNNEQFALEGKLNFDGKLSGLIKSPNFQGNVFLEQIVIGKEHLGQFTGLVGYQTETLSIAQGLLKQKSGGKADINLETNLSEGATSSVNLRFRSFLISQKFVKSAQNLALKSSSAFGTYVFSALKNLDGEINGDISLKGLPSIGDLRKPGFVFNLKAFSGKLETNITNSHNDALFQALAVKFVVENESINFSRIRLEIPSGEVIGTANYHIPSGNYKLDLNSSKLNILSFTQQMNQKGIPLSGIISVHVGGAGNISKPLFDVKVTSPDIMLNKENLRDLVLNAHASEGLVNLSLLTTYQGKSYELGGKVTLSDELPFEAQINLQNRSLLPLLALFTTVPPRIETIATGVLKIRGPLSTDEGLSLKKLKVLVDVSQLAVQFKTAREDENIYELVNEGPIVLEAGLNRLVFTKFNLKGDKTSFNVFGIVGGGNNTLKLKGDINLTLLNSLSNSLFISGSASFNATVTNGSNLAGSTDLRNISVRYIGSPIAIQQGNGKLLFSNDRVLLDNFVARSNGGQIKANGGLVFDKLNPNRLRLEVSASGLRVNYPETVHSVIDTDLLLQGSDTVQLLTGKINIRNSEYREKIDLAKLIASNFVFSIGDLTSFSFGNTLNLNVNVNAQDSIYVTNNIADLVGSGSLKITGTLNNPIISGRANVTRGTLTVRNDQYTITRGIVDFPNSRNGQIRFDIEADTDLRGYRIILNLAGTLSRFNTVLRSEPALPQPDIISLITTGQLLPPGTTDRASDSQTRLSPALGLLSETLSQKVEQNTDKLFGLSRFQIDPLIAGRGSNPTARVTLGRRIAKNLSLTYSTNITTGQEQIVVIEYQVNRDISIIGTREQDGTYGFDVRFRKRF